MAGVVRQSYSWLEILRVGLIQKPPALLLEHVTALCLFDKNLHMQSL